MAGDELHTLHDLRHRHVFRRVTGYLGVGWGGRDDDLRVGRDQVGGYHVEGEFVLPRVARAVALQPQHPARALGRQRARRVDRLDLRVRQPEYLVEPGDLPVDVQVVPACHDRDGGAGPVDPLAPQGADVVAEDVRRARVVPRELGVVLLHLRQDRGEHLDLVLLRWQATGGGWRRGRRGARAGKGGAGDAGPQRVPAAGTRGTGRARLGRGQQERRHQRGGRHRNGSPQ